MNAEQLMAQITSSIVSNSQMLNNDIVFGSICQDSIETNNRCCNLTAFIKEDSVYLRVCFIEWDDSEPRIIEDMSDFLGVLEKFNRIGAWD